MVSGAVVGGVVVTYYGTILLGKGLCKVFEGLGKAADTTLTALGPVAEKVGKSEFVKKREQRRQDLVSKFNDHSYRYWHDRMHTTYTIANVAIATGLLVLSRSSFRMAKLAPNMCFSGGLMSVGGVLVGGASPFLIGATINGHASACKITHPEDPKLARQVHQSFLERHPFLTRAHAHPFIS
jgi:hypothetical protein